MKKCVIFGASKSGQGAYKILSDEYEIIGFSDNNSNLWGKQVLGTQVYSPNEIVELDNIDIIIASVYYAAINLQLRDLGLQRIYVFVYYGSYEDANLKQPYDIIPLNDGVIFEKCKYDDEIISKMQDNYSINYNRKIQDKKICINTSRKKVLICAYDFPPIGGSGVQRTLKFVKYLRQYNYEPIVLTVGGNDGKSGEDKNLLDDLENDIEIIRIDQKYFLPESLSIQEQQEIYNLYCGVVQNKEWIKTYISFMKNNLDYRLIPENRIIWVNECLKHIDDYINWENIDCIYTTGYPYCTYILGYYLSKKHEKKWVMDYRDPWVSNEHYINHYNKDAKISIDLQRELEKVLVSHADKVIVVAESLIEEYVQLYFVEGNKFVTITNGFDVEDFANIKVIKQKNDKFILCYNGVIKSQRNPIGILTVINELIEEGRINEEEILWIFNGMVDDKYKNMILENDVYKVVKLNGYLEHQKSIEIANESDLLVLFGEMGEGSKYGYTGKVFEYLNMYPPILCLSDKQGVLDELLKKTSGGENFEYSDSIGIKNYIYNQFLNWKQGKSLYVKNKDEIQKYSRKSLTGQLAKVFD